MIPDQMNLYTQALEARIKVLEDKVARLEGNAPAPTGAHGSMTVSEPDPLGYVVASGNYANVREMPQYSSPFLIR